MRVRSASEMPIPVSQIVMIVCSLASETETFTSPPGEVYFTALSKILESIRCSIRESPRRKFFSGPWQCSVMCLSSAVGSKSSQALRINAPMSTSTREGLSRPASVFDMNSIVLIMSRRRSHSSTVLAAIFFIFAERFAGSESNLREPAHSSYRASQVMSDVIAHFLDLCEQSLNAVKHLIEGGCQLIDLIASGLHRDALLQRSGGYFLRRARHRLDA